MSIIQKVNGQLKKNPNLQIESVNSIDSATAGEITFVVKETIDTRKPEALP